MRSQYLPLALCSWWLAAAAAQAAPPPASAQEISIEWIYGGGPAAIEEVPDTVWLPGGELLIDRDAGGWELLDPTTGESRPGIDAAAARASLDAALGGTADALPFPVELAGGGRYACFELGGRVVILDRARSAFRSLDLGAVRAPRLAPDGRKLAFVRGGDLWVLDLEHGSSAQLTHDGGETVLNGTLTWVYWEEIFGRRDLGYWWSPDSARIAFLRTDVSAVAESTFVDFQPATPRVIRQRYPKAGTANPRVRLGIVAADGAGEPVWPALAADPAHAEYVARVQWLGDGRLSFQVLNRAQDRLELRLVDPDGAARTLLVETDPGWVNVHDDLRFDLARDELLWVSERTGHSHAYRYGLDGTPRGAVTSGRWALISSNPVFWLRTATCALDEAGDLYFTALRDGVTQCQLYRVGRDGGEPQRISQRPGTHLVSFSPDGRYYTDRHSAADTPPSLTLHRADGALVAELSPPRTEVVTRLGIRAPELFAIPAGDVELPAYLYKPADFDPDRRYPLILFTYAGPSSRSVTDAWQSGTYFDQLLLRAGFLVACVDNRSATGASKALENTILHRMTGPAELADILRGVEWLASRPYVDRDRIGIWGWSNGGATTLYAMTHSTAFKAGIAVAPVTDWHYYDTIWAEKVMKHPATNPRGYEETNLWQVADRLHGRLLLVHGTYDDNVHPQNAWHFVDALVRHNVQFDLMMYPMRKHGIADRAARVHLFTKMLEFWQRWL